MHPLPPPRLSLSLSLSVWSAHSEPHDSFLRRQNEMLDPNMDRPSLRQYSPLNGDLTESADVFLFRKFLCVARDFYSVWNAKAVNSNLP